MRLDKEASSGGFLAVWIAVAFVVWGALPGTAATIRVPGDYPTINQGLSASVSGDTVLVAPGTYTDVEFRDGTPSCAFLVGGVVLLSEAGPEATVIDMQGVSGGFANAVRAIGSDEAMHIEGFTVTGSPVWRAGIAGASIPKLSVIDCILRDLGAEGEAGGGISATKLELVIVDCLFDSCRAWAGSGVNVGNCNTRVVNSIFRDCLGNAFRQLGDDHYTGIQAVEIVDCQFLRNRATTGGGAFGTTVWGEVRVAGCLFEGNTADIPPGAVLLGDNLGWNHVMEDCVFVDNECFAVNGGGGALVVGGPSSIRNCTFYGNRQAWIGGGGSSIKFNRGLSTLENCIVANSQNGAAILRKPDAGVISSCNTFWGNEDGIGDGYTPGPTDFEADPLFCDPENGDFTLSSQSPCLPPASGDCGLIGALGKGCGPVSIRPESWGRIKELYRTGSGGER